MFKVLLIDADGVLITGKYFSERLAEKYKIPLEDILPFFKNEFKQCTVGKADLKEEIAKYLPKWGWNKSLDELLRFWFEGNKPDEKILRVLDQLRAKGIKSYVASDNEKYRAHYLMTEMGLSKYLDGGFFSYQMGCGKFDKRFFEQVLVSLKCSPTEILYWDDDEKNVEVAGQLGISAKFYKDFDSFNKELQNLQ